MSKLLELQQRQLLYVFCSNADQGSKTPVLVLQASSRAAPDRYGQSWPTKSSRLVTGATFKNCNAFAKLRRIFQPPVLSAGATFVSINYVEECQTGEHGDFSHELLPAVHDLAHGSHLSSVIMTSM